VNGLNTRACEHRTFTAARQLERRWTGTLRAAASASWSSVSASRDTGCVRRISARAKGAHRHLYGDHPELDLKAGDQMRPLRIGLTKGSSAQAEGYRMPFRPLGGQALVEEPDARGGTARGGGGLRAVALRLRPVVPKLGLGFVQYRRVAARHGTRTSSVIDQNQPSSAGVEAEASS
jgi:hypothetical protein